MIEFVAHIDRWKRPENFPEKVFIREVYGGIQSDEDLKNLYNKRFVGIISQPGLVVFRDDAEIIETKLTFDKRIYVPWHMITYFEGRVEIVTPQPVSEAPLENLSPVDPKPSEDDKKKLVN